MPDFRLPDVGEGLTEAEVVRWLVSSGDQVAVNDTLVEIETAKSVVELPSPAAGVVGAIRVAEGETVPVGTLLVSIDDGTSAESAPPKSPAESATAARADDEPAPLVLVGTGPQPAKTRTVRIGGNRGTRAEMAAPLALAAPSAPPAEATPPAAAAAGPRPTARAKPPVRYLAKRLGLALDTVTPSSGDIVSRADVERAAALADTAPVTTSALAAGAREIRIPIKGVRRATAAAMMKSAFTAPHVTEFLTVDVTRTMELLARLKVDRAWTGVRLTPLVLVARALVLAVRAHPAINARWEEESQEIVQPEYVNLGFATATPRGLLVPNVKEAQSLSLRELAGAIESLIDKARAGSTPLSAMTGGTISITNIGSLGVDTGTPILNPGEAAILAFGAVRDMPWVVDGQLAVRKVTQLALSFDHRLVDGELGSNVLVTLGRILSDPGETFALI